MLKATANIEEYWSEAFLLTLNKFLITESVNK